MPLIGTSTTITSIDELKQLSGERLTLTKNSEGKDAIVATKGTLTDLCYDVWALWCPKQAHNQNLLLIKSIKDNLLTNYSEPEKDIFQNHLLSHDISKNSTPLKLAKITCTQVSQLLSDTLPEFTKKITDFKRDTLSKMKFQDDHKKGGQIRAVAANNQTIKSEDVICDPKELLQKKEKKFDRDFQSFLSRTDKTISLKTLDQYLNVYSQPNSDTEADSTKNNKLINYATPVGRQTIQDPLNDIDKNLHNYTNFVLTFSPVANQISEIRRTLDYDKFFYLLSNLSNNNIPFKSNDGKQTLDLQGRNFFINHLLASFTVKSQVSNEKTQGNPETHRFFLDLGSLLASTNNSEEIKQHHHQTAEGLLEKANNLLKDDENRRIQTKKYMQQFKKDAENMQKVREDAENQRLQRQPIKGIKENSISEPLLSPHALTLLQEAIVLLNSLKSEPKQDAA